MNILICTRQAMLCVKGSGGAREKGYFPGGVRKKIDNEVAALENRGHTIRYFDGWNVLDPDHIDVVYIVGASVYTETLSRDTLANDIRTVVAPVFDHTHHPLFVRIASVTAASRRIHTNPGSIRYMCNTAETVCVSSDVEMEEVHKMFCIDREKIDIIPNYINVDNDLMNTTEELFVGTYGVNDFLICVGAIGNTRKNILRLIRIAGEMDVPTVIIGPDYDMKHAQICKKEAENYPNVHVIGCLSDRMLWSAYAAANTLVMPSAVENTGLVALEAAIMGANIVATEVGGTKYYLGDYAEYVNPKSDSSIKLGIEKAYGKKQSNGLRDHIMKNFNIDIVGEALENVLLH